MKYTINNYIGFLRKQKEFTIDENIGELNEGIYLYAPDITNNNMILMKEHGLNERPSRRKPKLGALYKALAEIKNLEVVQVYDDDKVREMYQNKESFIIPGPLFRKREINFRAYINGEIIIDIEEWFNKILSIEIVTAIRDYAEVKSKEKDMTEKCVEAVYDFISNRKDNMSGILNLI